MRKRAYRSGLFSVALSVAAAVAPLESATCNEAAVITVDPAKLPAIGKVDERFLSFNVESVEVTGGNFWAPYPKEGATRPKPVPGPHGTEFATDAYQQRDPIDLTGNARLRMLTRALGPSYMRVSGSWANSIYFQDDDEPLKAPPAGYQGVLTRTQWASVVDFAKAVDAKILTSFAVSDGARRPDGSWNPEQASRLFAYTRSLGGQIDAVELMNEPNARRTPYAADDYARDHETLRKLVADVSPQTVIVGPGSTGEAGFKLFANPPEEMSTIRLLSGQPQPKFDVFSHHFYGAVSQRCKSLGERRQTEVTTSAAEALSESWLARADQAQTFYKAMRNRFAPGSPIWITETAQAACGGDPWSATFLDTFRYVDQLGRLAQQGATIMFHNTLAASDYALIDDVTWQPRPNYWATLLWHKVMGPTVLKGGSNEGDLHVYAHCLRQHQGGVALVAINLNRSELRRLEIAAPARLHSLTADMLESGSVKYNGTVLKLSKNDQLPELIGKAIQRGAISLAPASVTFLELPQAGNPACTDNDQKSGQLVDSQ